MKNIQAVLFDCDGVLLNSEHVVNSLMHKELKKFDNDYNLTYEELDKGIKGLLDADIIKFLITKEVKFNKAIFDTVNYHIENNYSDFAEKVDNVNEMLESLSKIPKVVCSNTDTELFSKALEEQGLAKHFEFCIGKDLASAPKPAPDLYLLGAEKLEINIENCLIIEDSANCGILAAKASGANTVVGFAGTGTKPEDLINNGADYVIHDLLELPELIEKLNN